MSSLDDRDAWMKHKYFKPEDIIYSDYTYFYVTIIICSLLATFLLAVNIIFCYCSPHRSYWRNRHTGNRFIVSLWTSTPHNNPPLDLTELEQGVQKSTLPFFTSSSHIPEESSLQYQVEEIEERESITERPQRYQELLQKRESDI